MTTRVFLISPARCTGRRAELLIGGAGRFALAQRLAAGEAVPLADAFTFMSGLYFRGKLAYARAFATAPAGADGVGGVLVMTTNRGLVNPDTPVDTAALRDFGHVDIDPADARYREPLMRDAGALERSLPADAQVVLLGSIATAKYVELLLGVFGDRLVFPAEFVGRGDMSRGGLLLRCVDAGEELEYVAVRGTPRRGSRPPRLEPRQ